MLSNELTGTVYWQTADGGYHTGRLVLDPEGWPLCANADLGLPLAERRLHLRTLPGDKEAWAKYSDLKPYLGDKTPKGE